MTAFLRNGAIGQLAGKASELRRKFGLFGWLRRLYLNVSICFCLRMAAGR